MRKLYSLFAVVLVLAFLAAACAQPTPETIVETVVVEKEVEVVKTEIVEKESSRLPVTSPPILSSPTTARCPTG